MQNWSRKYDLAKKQNFANSGMRTLLDWTSIVSLKDIQTNTEHKITCTITTESQVKNPFSEYWYALIGDILSWITSILVDIYLYNLGHSSITINHQEILTHLPRVPHIWNVSALVQLIMKCVSIGSVNGLSPLRRQTITWINAGLLSTGLRRTNFSEILIGILSFSFTHMYLKLSSANMAAILSRGRWVKQYGWHAMCICSI